jgi:hypothetical protein
MLRLLPVAAPADQRGGELAGLSDQDHSPSVFDEGAGDEADDDEGRREGEEVEYFGFSRLALHRSLSDKNNIRHAAKTSIARNETGRVNRGKPFLFSQ